MSHPHHPRARLDPDTPSHGADAEDALHADLHATAVRHTAAALQECEAATDGEIETSIARCNQHRQAGRFPDLIELIAHSRANPEDGAFAAAILEMAEATAYTIANPPSLVPFAARLIKPSAFYESFTTIHEVARHLGCPVLFAEDHDAIGTGSINPIAAIMMADFIAETVHAKSGIKPFVSSVRMDYPDWSFVTRKHFES